MLYMHMTGFLTPKHRNYKIYNLSEVVASSETLSGLVYSLGVCLLQQTQITQNIPGE